MLEGSSQDLGRGVLPPGRSTFYSRNRCLLMAVMGLFIGASGCSTLVGQPDAIRVTVSRIVVEQATLLEQAYNVTLRVQNRTEFPLGVRGGSFDLVINGRDFGSGVSNVRVDIPAFEDAQIELRMVSTLFGMLRLIQGLQDRTGGSLSYEISGRIAIEGSMTGLSFREQGEFGPEQPSTTEQMPPR